MTCTHWTNAQAKDGGRCSLKAKTVSFGVCRLCPENTAPGAFPPAKNILQKLRIGTHIAEATTAIGIKPCGGCKRRAQILNGDKPDLDSNN
jgi:hypothetical protein